MGRNYIMGYVAGVDTTPLEERKHNMKVKDLMEYLEKVDRTEEFLTVPAKASLPEGQGSQMIPQSEMLDRLQMNAQLARQQNIYGNATSFASPMWMQGTSTTWRNP